MNIETLVIILILSLAVAIFARLVSGWTLSGFLFSYLLACAGGVGGWILQRRLGLPSIYDLRLPGSDTPVMIVWPGLMALIAGLAGGFIWRPTRPRRRSRR